MTLSENDSVLKISSVLDFNTVANLRDQADAFIQSVAEPVFDFQEVTSTESAALALLTAWYRKSRALGKTPRFINLPVQLMDIAKLSNLDKVLQLAPGKKSRRMS